ncbi:MAG: TldD/PmbA family protein, partial [Peptoniphilaceae bacterium]|nr:TldD/PmbA family protein [Peptoniphilaceae bacterium]
MKLKTSNYLLEKKEALQDLVARLSEEFSYVSVLGTDVTGTAWIVQTSGMALRPSDDEERGFVVRVMQPTGFTEYSFNELDVDAVVNEVRQKAAEERAWYLKTAQPLPYLQTPKDEPIEKSFVQEVDALPEESDPREILTELKQIHDSVKEKHE